ncbi:calcium-dependent phosphotriesterase [Imleria badia]|nr:calcium-dependent phosphotriesterase [Imleria badia]
MLLTVAAVFFAVLGAFYFHAKPALSALGVGRVIQPVGNTNCRTVPQLQACEKLVLHQPSGLVYLACSTPHSRSHWTPALDRLNASGRSEFDYVATYDPRTDAINQLSFSGPLSPGGISLHGMDVVPSSDDSSLLYVYLVNHRKPISADARTIGADSVIEVFKTRIGSSTLEHLRTFQDPAVVITPNDVVGSPDGKSVHFTNDHRLKTGFSRLVSLLALSPDTSIGFCHADQGCKFAYTGLHAGNGIVKGKNDTFYVADCVLGGVTVLERQADNTLAFTEVIKTDRGLDNLAIDANGALWAAGLSDTLGMVTRQINDPSALVASSALRITINRGPSSFYGEKYNIDKVFEDPGELASGSTSAVYDAERARLFMHGLMSPHLTMCSL